MNKQFSDKSYSGTDYLKYYVDALSRVYGNDRCARTVTIRDGSNSSSGGYTFHGSDASSFSDLLLLAAQLERQTQTCFGSSLRSRTLGSRHTDKSIYADQLVRWFLNFRPTQFVIISLSSFAENASSTVSTLLQFLVVDGHVDGPPDVRPPLHEQKKLSRPNNLTDLRENQLLDGERKILADFFAPYNLLLNSILCADVVTT
jgi:hypothetical protein